MDLNHEISFLFRKWKPRLTGGGDVLIKILDFSVYFLLVVQGSYSGLLREFQIYLWQNLLPLGLLFCYWTLLSKRTIYVELISLVVCHYVLLETRNPKYGHKLFTNFIPSGTGFGQSLLNIIMFLEFKYSWGHWKLSELVSAINIFIHGNLTTDPKSQILEDKPDLSQWSLKYKAFGRDIEFSWLARNMQVRMTIK